MKRLPAALADPLHLEYPIPWPLIALLGALLVAGIVYALLRSWLRRRRPAPRRELPAPLPAAPAGIAAAIEALRERYREAGSFRQACHELSTLLRHHFERRGPHRYSTLTAGEIRRMLGDGRTARFFALLAELQFGRRRPTRSDLDGACDLALEVAGEERG